MKMREEVIGNYIDGYNNFDIEKMLFDLDENIEFKNIQNNEVNLSLKGIKEFKNQAKQASSFFSERKQTIKSISHNEHTTEIGIEYFAILSVDFPHGLKKGDKLKLEGKSVFEFSKNNKILKITDIS